jgi:uncharacterized protein (DUF1697 family)
MVYVALLRGINVGGKNIVEMARLKQAFEELGFTSVKTYINSGNVIFRTERMVDAGQIEERILRDFGLNVPVPLRDLAAMTQLMEGLPDAWVNDTTMKCDVMFLWPAIDSSNVLEQIPHNPEI